MLYAPRRRTPYRLFFATLDELEQWLSGARSYLRADPFEQDQFYVWVRTVMPKRMKNPPTYQVLRIARELFKQDGRLKSQMELPWQDDFLSVERLDEKPSFYPNPPDDDIPF